MKLFFKKHLITFIGIILGAIAGFFYWRQIGCNSGNCAITSSPFNSTIYGAIMGGLLLSIFKKDSRKATE